MLETQQIVDLWKRARIAGDTVYLATVVHVKGSSYRKQGARMLVTSGGERAGTISGGCLEAEVSKRIAWITRESSAMVSYQSSFDDDAEGVPYGLGCGGTIWILMETGDSAIAVLNALERAVDKREASVVVSCLKDGDSGTALVLDGMTLTKVWSPESEGAQRLAHLNASEGLPLPLLSSCQTTLQEERPVSFGSSSPDAVPDFLCMPVLPALRLKIFGAGDDAKPIVRFAAELGWNITVADGRAPPLASGALSSSASSTNPELP